MIAMDVKCRRCGAELEPSAEACSACGSGDRNVTVSHTLVPVLHQRVDLKGGPPNEEGRLTKSRVRYKARVGSDPSQLTASGRADIDRRFDLDGRGHGGVPWYSEKVVDPDTGAVLMDKSHPLGEKGPSGSEKPRE